MKTLLGVCLLALAFTCHSQQSNSPSVEAGVEANQLSERLLGRWRSNKELSYASAKNVKGISDKALQYLNDNVFGMARREFTANKMRTFFGRIKPNDKTTQFQPYRIIERQAQYIKIETVDPLTDKKLLTTLYWAEDCFYELVSEKQYREYFCREEEETPKTRFRAVPNTYNLEQ